MQFATPAFDRPSTLLRLSTETIKFEDDLGHPGRGLWQRRFAFRPTHARLSEWALVRGTMWPPRSLQATQWKFR